MIWLVHIVYINSININKIICDANTCIYRFVFTHVVADRSGSNYFNNREIFWMSNILFDNAPPFFCPYVSCLLRLSDGNIRNEYRIYYTKYIYIYISRNFI